MNLNNFITIPYWQFIHTPKGAITFFVILGLIVLVFLMGALFAAMLQAKKENQARTLLLTSSGMQMKEEIIKLLQKPAYDIQIGFIVTAAKPLQDLSFVQADLDVMKEVGFNVEMIDIEGKTEEQVYQLLEFKDMIFVEGGNTFYLLAAMQKCNFEKTIKKLLKLGKVYVGSSAGSIVAGKTIQTADNFGSGTDNATIKLQNLRGLNLVPFDIFCHYQPDNAEIVKQKIPDVKKRYKDLRMLTDQQAILVQGSTVNLIGQGEQIVL